MALCGPPWSAVGGGPRTLKDHTQEGHYSSSVSSLHESETSSTRHLPEACPQHTVLASLTPHPTLCCPGPWAP